MNDYWLIHKDSIKQIEEQLQSFLSLPSEKIRNKTKEILETIELGLYETTAYPLQYGIDYKSPIKAVFEIGDWVEVNDVHGIIRAIKNKSVLIEDNEVKVKLYLVEIGQERFWFSGDVLNLVIPYA